MQNLKINSKIVAIFILVIISSCINSTKEDEIVKAKLTKATNLELTFDFPNKPELGASEFGKVKYKSDLDTINLKKDDRRITLLCLGNFKKSYSIEELKKKPLDTFPADINGDIPFWLTLKEEGEFVLDGYILDLVYLKENDEKKGIKTIANETKISKKVTVVKEYTVGDEKNDNLRVFIRLKDKIFAKEEEYGEVIYKSYLDTIQLKEKDMRIVVFHFGVFKETHSISELKGKTTDSFRISKKGGYIPFNVTFDKGGEFVLEGYVDEMVFIENRKADVLGRMITQQTKISKKVTVVKE